MTKEIENKIEELSENIEGIARLKHIEHGDFTFKIQDGRVIFYEFSEKGKRKSKK